MNSDWLRSAIWPTLFPKRSQHYVKIPALPLQWDGNDSRRCDHYRSKGSCCLSAQYNMRLGDPILTARILLKGPNRRWGSTSVTGRLSWLEHNGHRVASPRPQHASKRHSGTYVGGSQLGSICHSATPRPGRIALWRPPLWPLPNCRLTAGFLQKPAARSPVLCICMPHISFQVS